MSTVRNIEEERAKLALVEAAARHFAEHVDHDTYGTLESGAWLAMRWGLTDRAILILKLDADFTPEVYGDAVPWDGVHREPCKACGGRRPRVTRGGKE